jgi:hypothetical protein
VWPVGDLLFGAPSKSAPWVRAPLAPPKGRPCPLHEVQSVAVYCENNNEYMNANIFSVKWMVRVQ